MTFGGEIFCVEDDWEELVDTILECFDVEGKGADESLVEIYQICKQIVSNNDAIILGCELLANFLELFVNCKLIQLGFPCIFVGKPLRRDTREVTAGQSFEDPSETWKDVSISGGIFKTETLPICVARASLKRPSFFAWNYELLVYVKCQV